MKLRRFTQWVLKQNLNSWEENVYAPKREISETALKVRVEISKLAKELMETEISDDTKEVVEMIIDETSIKYDKYLRTLFCCSLICPSPALGDFAFQSFGILDYISQIILNIRKNLSIRDVAEEVFK